MRIYISITMERKCYFYKRALDFITKKSIMFSTGNIINRWLTSIIIRVQNWTLRITSYCMMTSKEWNSFARVVKKIVLGHISEYINYIRSIYFSECLNKIKASKPLLLVIKLRLRKFFLPPTYKTRMAKHWEMTSKWTY